MELVPGTGMFYHTNHLMFSQYELMIVDSHHG